MINPMSFMKVQEAMNKISANHPKLMPFIEAVRRKGITQGCIIDISVTDQNGETIATNVRVTQEDLDTIAEIRRLSQ